MPSGRIPIAIKFADLLTPHPPTPPKPTRSFFRLPKATDDINQAKRDIGELGYGFSKNVLSPEQVAIMRKVMAATLANSHERGY